MKILSCSLGLFAGVILLMTAPIQAHHSIPAFWDEAKSIEISGTVKQMKIVNPHSELRVEVTAADGSKETWVGVAGLATQMIKAGWTNDTLKAGTPIKVEGAPPKKIGAKGILVRKITLPDGRVLTSGKID
jgi:hypothetical protein